MDIGIIVKGIIAIVLGYLLGSIPTAYLATRIATGRDIRRLGGGNVGGLNVFREVGIVPAVVVGIVDLGKGVAAVALAQWVLQVPPPLVLAAAVASVVGHNWMVWLKFSGGKGMGVSIGSLAILLPLYGYPWGLAIFFGMVLIPFIITRNVALSMGFGLLSLPFIGWLGMHSNEFVIFSVVLGLIILLKFIPTAMVTAARTRSAKGFIFDRVQRGKR
jgi:glycerol-3-phosphate acyltransferase PlsY